MLSFLRAIAFALAAVVLSAAPGAAQFGASPQRPDIRADLVVGGYDAREPGVVWLGLRIRLGSGWKTYWRSPGDGGLPAEFDWAASRNLSQPEVLWPAPRRMEILGVETIGYKDEVVFPIKARVDDPAAPAEISLKLALYACSTLCVRDDQTFTAAVAPGQSDPQAQALIERWRERVPGLSSPALSVTALRLVETEPPQIEIDVAAAEPLVAPDLFVESDPPVIGGRPRVADRGASATLAVDITGEKIEALRGRVFTVTLVDGARAVEARSPAVAAAAATPGLAAKPADRTAEPAADRALWAMVGVALLGGFILNLMPCVFPVLSLKLLGFVKQEDAAVGRIRAGFAASAAGIVACFLALATAMVALKAAGATVGWGIQFQQPIFLALMAAVITLFAANLLGLFEVRLPGGLAGRLDRTGRGESLMSHFASGFVATLLATPCSAPFVGTAVGFALAAGAVEIYLVFAALGLGMALPYLAVVAVPRVAAMLPRPGRWMLVVKQALAVALLATAAWLTTVLAAIAGSLAALALAVVLALALLGLYLRRRAPASLRVAFALGAIAIPATVVAAVGFGDIGASAPQPDGVSWRRFDEAEVRSLVGSGRTVLVDITAQWCVTCKVNKALVLEDGEVERRLKGDVVPIQGDWTRPDERIAAYLKSFGRYGLPFNVVYGPGAPDGIVLPELLTDAAVLDAFARASAGPQPANLASQR